MMTYNFRSFKFNGQIKPYHANFIPINNWLLLLLKGQGCVTTYWQPIELLQAEVIAEEAVFTERVGI